VAFGRRTPALRTKPPFALTARRTVLGPKRSFKWRVFAASQPVEADFDQLCSVKLEEVAARRFPSNIRYSGVEVELWHTAKHKTKSEARADHGRAKKRRLGSATHEIDPRQGGSLLRLALWSSSSCSSRGRNMSRSGGVGGEVAGLGWHRIGLRTAKRSS